MSKSRKNPDCIAFEANVRRERMAPDMTQERLAELVDLNIRTGQKIEEGEINILLTTVVRFFRVLNCPRGRLMPVKERAGSNSP